MAYTLEHSKQNEAVRTLATNLIGELTWEQAWQSRQTLIEQTAIHFTDMPKRRLMAQVHAAIRQLHPQSYQNQVPSDSAILPDTEHQIWLGDCLEVAGRLKQKFQLLKTSTPYPLLAGFDVSVVEYMADWWWRRLRALLPLLDQETGVVAQNIKFARRDGWYDNDAERQLIGLYESEFGLHCVDRYIWDRKNPPPRGNMEAHDPDGWEYIFVFAFGRGYLKKFSHFYGEYSKKTVLKAGSAAGMRSVDVRGRMGEGHNGLSEKGSIRSNIIRASNSGGTARRRVPGGVYPPELPIRMISQFSQPGDWILDPFTGSGTTNVAAYWLGRNSVGIDIGEYEVGQAAGWLHDEMGKPADSFIHRL